MSIRRLQILLVALALAVPMVGYAAKPPKAVPSGPDPVLDNGIVGDGHVTADVTDAGSADMSIDPTGATGLRSVVFYYSFFADPGANGGAIDLRTSTITTAANLSGPQTVSSAGNFAGANATINWTSSSNLPLSGQVLTNTLTFTSASAFGVCRIIGYLDEDITVTTDELVEIGTPGGSNFQLLTIGPPTSNFGVAQAAGFLSPTNATYIGWAARPYSTLISAITGAGATYSIPGVITGLASTTDSRFPSDPVFGPADITSAVAFDLNPTATTATITFSLGGSPSGQPPGGGAVVAVPTLSKVGFVVLIGLIAALGVFILSRRLT